MKKYLIGLVTGVNIGVVGVCLDMGKNPTIFTSIQTGVQQL
jgi:hypothetical protein